MPSGCRGRPRGRSRRLRWPGRRRSSTRSSGRGSPGSRVSRQPARSRRSTTPVRRRRPVVVACDVPSGVDASTGEVAGAAVRARATATFHAAKPGLWIDPGKTHAGEVRVIDIGIPEGGPGEPQVGLISDRASDGIPRRGTGLEQVRRRQRARLRRVAGADRRAVHGVRGGDARRRRLRDRMRAVVAEPDLRVPAARGDDRAAARYGRVARASRRRGGARAGRPRRCARARAGPRARAGGAGVRAPAGRCRAGATAARRRRAERARGGSGPARRARGRDRADPACRRARAPARDRQRGESARGGWTARAGPLARRRRSSC